MGCKMGYRNRVVVLLVMMGVIGSLVLVPLGASAANPAAPPLGFAQTGVDLAAGEVWAVVENNTEQALVAGVAWRLWFSARTGNSIASSGVLPALAIGETYQISTPATRPEGVYRFQLLFRAEHGYVGSFWSDEISLNADTVSTSPDMPTAAPVAPTEAPTLAPTPTVEAAQPTASPTLEATAPSAEATHTVLIPTLGQAAPTPTALPLPPRQFLSPPVQDSSAGEINLSLGDFTNNSPLILQGYIPSAAIYMPLEEGWSVIAGRLVVHFRHSATLQPGSTLTIKVNRIPVASERLTAENITAGTIEVDLPPAVLESDAFEVAFSGFLWTTEDVCSLLDDESAWVTIEPSSRIDLTLNRATFQPNLGRLPYPFVRERIPRNHAALIVLADTLDARDWAAMLPLAGYLGSAANWRDYRAYAILERELSAEIAESYDLIFVGRRDALRILQDSQLNLPLNRGVDGGFLDPDGQPVGPGVGVILEISSPWNRLNGALVITGETSEALDRAVQALASPLFTNLARGDYALVTQPLAEQAIGATSNQLEMTLESLGYQELVMQGVGRQTSDITINLPPMVQVKKAQLTTRLSHSAFLWRERSYLNIYVNDVPVKGVYLDDRNEQRGEFSVELPAEYFVSGSNTVRFMFDLRLEDWNCIDSEYTRAWGVIHRDTRLAIELAPGREATDLSGFPTPYAGGALWVLPDTMTPETMAGSLLLMTQLGREFGASIRQQSVVTASDAERVGLGKQSVVAIGLPNNNAVLAKVVDRLPYPLEESSTAAIRSERRLGIVQQIKSPWNQGKSLLVISGMDDETVGRAAYLLADLRLRPRLQGQVALVDGEGVITTINPQAAPTPAPGRAENTRATPSYVTYIALAALGVLVVVIGIALVRRLTRSNADKQEPLA